MKTIFYLALILFILGINSCSNDKNKRVYYPNGIIKTLTIVNTESNMQKIEYDFFEDGELKEIKRYNNDHVLDGEQLSFFDNGKLEQKLQFKKGKANGCGYYFYNLNGTLKNTRYFRNDKQVLYGADYWGNDSMNIIKATLHFNDSGHIYYKKNFSENGQFINEEGKNN
ncbi:MAG: hypothetical protein ABJA78_11850 [Ferruginibacter sp.]